jgi:hypothetical protein
MVLRSSCLAYLNRLTNCLLGSIKGYSNLELIPK